MDVDSITLDRDKIKELLITAETQPDPEASQANQSNQASQVSQPKGKSQQPAPKKKKEEKVTLKSVLCKMVPYASFPYADHILRGMQADPNGKIEPKDEALIDTLIEAA